MHITLKGQQESVEIKPMPLTNHRNPFNIFIVSYPKAKSTSASEAYYSFILNVGNVEIYRRTK